MREEKPAFIRPCALRATYSLMTNATSVCSFWQPILPRTRKASCHRVQDFKISAKADGPYTAVEPILEGDLIAYRDRTKPVWNIGAVVETPKGADYHVRSLYSRTPAEDGTVECFVNWEADSLELTITPDTYEITIVEADYEERVVQDRLENPHGEVSEDCWRISTQLLDSFGVAIREHDTV